jgi:hypothetical protein
MTARGSFRGSRQRRTRRLPRAYSLATALLLTSSTACAGTQGSPGPATAPTAVGLLAPPPSGWAEVMPVGERFTNGWLVVQLTGEHRLRIDGVEVEQAGDGLKFLGAKIAGIDRKHGLRQRLPSWPPPSDQALGDVQDAVGAELVPGELARTLGFEILLGFDVIGEGRSTVKSVDLTYTDLDTKKEDSITVVSTMAICTPPAVECAHEHGSR